ncbi:MAG TPA: TonB-dependent receptor [Thermoanaerobaculia bacterium]|nr:TonB-dependent receptor [Thermoanaerobaculia bacterium]
MSTFLRFFVVLLLFSSSALGATISGTIRDFHGRPLGGVLVSIGSVRSVTSSPGGQFAVEVPPGAYLVRFTHPGFHTESRELKAGDSINILLVSSFEETITVSGIRAEETTPVTTTDVSRQEIERTYHQQDIPLLIRDTPSINAWAESGVGSSGYSYFTLRGISPTRINFTLDGVPLADSEDFGTYFVDFPDLAHSLQSVQIQRGVGTSSVGSPSFGGSVNLESIALSRSPETHVRLAGGSFGQAFGTAAYQTGSLPGGFSFYTRVSYGESDGFRESSATQQRNVFVSAAKQNENSVLKLTGFSGREEQQLSFYAADADTLRTNLRANPLSPDEIDAFSYDLAHLQYLTTAGGSDVTASVYYQRGYGGYRLYDWGSTTDLRHYGLDGVLVGTMATLGQRSGNVTTNYGIHVNRFKRDHTRDLVGAGRDYENYGVKGEASAFAKVSWDRDRMHLYGDAQVRHADFEYSGDVDIDPIRWTFFNPKAGVRFDVSPRSSVYASAGISTREPTRNDMFLGEDNPSVPHDLRAVRPERLFNVEAGLDFRTPSLILEANLYAMEFRNEIAATGELSEIGLPLRRNVDSSYRRGLELDASWELSSALRLRSVANLSRNRISEWTQFYDVYDANGEWIDSRPVTYHDVEPLLTPSVILSQGIEYTPSATWSAGVTGRYVGEAYLDNTNDLRTPSFVTADANVSVALSRAFRLSLQANNLFDNDEIFPSGYSYLFMNRDVTGIDSVSGVPYYFPMATRNFVVMLDFRL